MKQIITLLTVVLCTASLAPDTQAQMPSTVPLPVVSGQVAESYEQRSDAWWNALGRQLTDQLDGSVADVDPIALQNTIFFARMHADAIDLKDAVPSLLDIYGAHPRVELRLMALAALHAIGDEAAMQRIMRMRTADTSPRVQRMTLAVLNDHYNR